MLAKGNPDEWGLFTLGAMMGLSESSDRRDMLSETKQRNVDFFFLRRNQMMGGEVGGCDDLKPGFVL